MSSRVCPSETGARRSRQTSDGFRTYEVDLDSHALSYARALESHDTIEKWRQVAITAPSIPVYDEGIRNLGGDPEAGRPSQVP